MNALRHLGAFLDNPSIPWKTLIIGASVTQFVVESYLSYRQHKVLQRTTLPLQLKNEVDQKTFDKSQAYGRAKSKFGLIKGVWSLAKGIFVINADIYPKIWAFAGVLISRFAPARFSGEISHSLVFVFSFAFVEAILGLPFDYYYHFILEESFGFNKQTISLFVTDFVKSQLLSLAFGIPLGAAFLKIIQVTGEQFFWYVWLFMLAVQLAAVTIYPILIVPLFNKLTPLEAGPLKDRVETLAKRLEFPLAELYVIDGSKRSAHSNAYFTGLPWKKTIVLYDTLIEKSEIPEVEAVLSHELGHWQMGHTTKLLGIASAHLFYVFALFSVFINNGSLFRAFGFFQERPIIVGFILFNEVLSPTDSFVKLGMNIVTRKFEFEADAFSKKLGYATDLASSLIKLQIQNLSSMDADWAYSSYHYSHPILTERLKAVGWTSEKKVSTSQPSINGKAEEPKKEL